MCICDHWPRERRGSQPTLKPPEARTRLPVASCQTHQGTMAWVMSASGPRQRCRRRGGQAGRAGRRIWRRHAARPAAAPTYGLFFGSPLPPSQKDRTVTHASSRRIRHGTAAHLWLAVTLALSRAAQWTDAVPKFTGGLEQTDAGVRTRSPQPLGSAGFPATVDQIRGRTRGQRIL
jgi:hypothetical protein